jgi:hypothetical protein
MTPRQPRAPIGCSASSTPTPGAAPGRARGQAFLGRLRPKRLAVELTNLLHSTRNRSTPWSWRTYRRKPGLRTPGPALHAMLEGARRHAKSAGSASAGEQAHHRRRKRWGASATSRGISGQARQRTRRHARTWRGARRGDPALGLGVLAQGKDSAASRLVLRGPAACRPGEDRQPGQIATARTARNYPPAPSSRAVLAAIRWQHDRVRELL